MAQQSGIEKAGGINGGQKDDKKVVAGGIAITVVIILLVVWGIFFIHRIQSGSQNVKLGGGAQDQFNPPSVKQAQQDINNSYGNLNQDLQDLRNQADSGSATQQQVVQQTNDTPTDQFVNPTQ